MSTQKYPTAGAPTPTVDAVDDTSTPPLTAGVSTRSTPGQSVEHPRVLSRCTHLPALRCAADDSAADSAAPSHAIATAAPHLSVSAKAEPSTGPDERTAQPGRPPPAGGAGNRCSTSGRFRAAAARVVGAAALPAVPSFPRTHALCTITGTTRSLHIPTNADSPFGRFALRPIRTLAPSPQNARQGRRLWAQQRLRMRHSVRACVCVCV